MAHSFIEYAVRLSIAFSEVSNMIFLSFFSSSTDCLKTSSLRCHFLHLAPVVQNMDSTVHWINLGNQLRRDLSRGVIRLLNNWGQNVNVFSKLS